MGAEQKDTTPKIEIKNRWTGEVLKTVNATTLTGADLTGADLTRAYLTGAYLTRAYLTRAYLTGAYLTGADLTGADLTGAYLTGAYLTRADLTGAYLTGADLTGAYLTRADLTRADLTGAKFAWSSHDLVAEVLRRAAGEDTEKLKIAGLILVLRDKCWPYFLKLDDPLKPWALDTLALYLVDGDEAPDELRDWAKERGIEPLYKPVESEESED